MDEEKQLIENEPLNTGDMTADAGQKKAGAKPGWEEILSDPEYRECYDRAVQGIVQKRLKNSREAEERLLKLQPLLKAVAEHCGTEPESLDAETAAEMIMAGIKKQAEAGEKILRHLGALMAQEAELKKSVPEFELSSALEDPRFLRLTAPHTGLCLADAYFALHRQEIGRAAVKEGLEALSRSLRSGGERPRELSGGREAHSFSADPRSMTKAEREALKKRIYEAGARREKLYP